MWRNYGFKILDSYAEQESDDLVRVRYEDENRLALNPLYNVFCEDSKYSTAILSQRLHFAVCTFNIAVIGLNFCAMEAVAKFNFI